MWKPQVLIFVPLSMVSMPLALRWFATTSRRTSEPTAFRYWPSCFAFFAMAHCKIDAASGLFEPTVLSTECQCGLSALVANTLISSPIRSSRCSPTDIDSKSQRWSSSMSWSSADSVGSPRILTDKGGPPISA